VAAPATPSVNPIALSPGEGEALWFFGALVIVKASSETTAGRVTVIEHLVPQGAGPPLHVYHREDEWFYVIEGERPSGQDHQGAGGSFRIRSARHPPHLHRYVFTSAQHCGHRARRVREVHARSGGSRRRHARFRRRAFRCRAATRSWQPRPTSGSKYSARQAFLLSRAWLALRRRQINLCPRIPLCSFIWNALADHLIRGYYVNYEHAYLRIADYRAESNVIAGLKVVWILA